MHTRTDYRRSLALTATAALTLAGHARADWLELVHGTRHQGRLVSRTDELVAFETMIEGRRVLKTFPAAEVRSVVESPLPADFFKQASIVAKPAVKPAVKAKAPETMPARQVRKRYLEVPLRGVFGDDFDAGGVKDALAAASKAGVDAVIYVLDSDGGDVAVAEDIMKAIIGLDARIRQVVRVHKAISASIWVLASVDEVFAEPGAAAGAAVAYAGDPSSGSAAVDAKFISAKVALISSLVEERRPRCVPLYRAMMEQEAEVFARLRQDGTYELSASPPLVDEREWITLDTKTQVLTLTTDEVIKYGLASPWASSEFVGEEWEWAGDAGMLAMQRSAERLRDFKKASEWAERLAPYITQAVNTPAPNEFDDYTYSTVQRESLADIPARFRPARPLTAASTQVFRGRYRAYTDAWGRVLNGGKDIVRLIDKHHKYVPEDLQGIKAIVSDAVKIAENKLF